LLRPLCAKLLKPTRVEEEGLVDRERLLDIQGRSRKRQIELAARLDVKGYGTPAGGCALTDITYARKYLDLVGNIGRDITVRDTVLLSTGRHLRISPSCKVVVGRNQEENEYLEAEWADHWLATTPDQPGPTVVVVGEASEEDLMTAAAITARYSDGKGLPEVRISLGRDGEEKVVSVAPVTDEQLDAWRI
ncbi:MAG TPA: hypothetical protein VLA34_11970, partial [Candidatus Krumholzibacterium sp.]|nr:hypothetical protein [Candidatus Krumholzibacterium sp.]